MSLIWGMMLVAKCGEGSLSNDIISHMIKIFEAFKNILKIL